MQIDFKERNKQTTKRAIIYALISFILFTVFYYVILRHEWAADKERYGYIARNQADHIITTIDCIMSRTDTLKALVKENEGNTYWFEDVAEDLYISVKDETGIELKNLTIAPNGVVSNVYPLEENEALIGFDFLDTSLVGNLEAKEAYDNNNTGVTNPFELIQGGTGMGGRSAVYIKKDGNSSFWGLVTVTIDFDNLIKVIDMDNLNGMGVDYNLSYIDSDGKAHVMYGVGELGKDTVKAQFNVRNLIWELEVIPKQGWVTTEEIVISVLFILMLSCFVGLLTYMMIQLRENNVMLQQMSTTDAMTGCQNRRAYEDKMLELSTGKIGKDLVYISADINGLKGVNDTLGHAAGDELISGATSCLQKGFSPYGSLYRIGGDEFAALLSVKEGQLDGILENVKKIVKDWKGETVNELHISIGYAAHREFPDLNIEELGKCADKRMYEQKSEYYKTHDRRR